RLVFAAGQGGENSRGELAPDFLAQVRQALDNVQTALHAAGATLFDVAKLTVLVVDHNQERLALFSNEIKSRWGIHLAPACTLIPVPRLALDGMLVEIEATALLPL
ncbi:MAG: RidA family protein, partial [Achromobacter xylosoxidans]|nr:RidA family protein [Achromobacter xylosoxidans]